MIHFTYLKTRYYVLRSLFPIVILFQMLFTNSIASPAFYTWGSLDQALTLSAPELASSASITSSNPASLAWLKPQLSIGIVYAREHLTWQRHRLQAKSKVSSEIYQAQPFNSNGMNSNDSLKAKPLASEEIKSPQLDQRAREHMYAQIALNKHIFRDKDWGNLHLGARLLVPLQNLEVQTPLYPDERAQYFDQKVGFERWGDSLEGLSGALALAYSIQPYWSLGVGMNLLNRSFAQSDVYLQDINQGSASYIAPNIEVKNALTPFMSLEGRWKRWGLHASIHAAEEIRVTGESKVKIWGFPYPDNQDAIVQKFKKTYRALPMRSRLGMAWRGKQLQWAAHIAWAQWSKFYNRHAEATQWIDQWQTGTGLLWKTPSIQWGLDTRWRPTPVPPQIGRSNYIDPSQWAWSLGMEYKVNSNLSLVLNAQIHILLQRSDRKNQKAQDPVIDEFPISINAMGDPIASSEGLQSNNFGYPGYDSSGLVWSTACALKIYYDH